MFFHLSETMLNFPIHENTAGYKSNTMNNVLNILRTCIIKCCLNLLEGRKLVKYVFCVLDYILLQEPQNLVLLRIGKIPSIVGLQEHDHHLQNIFWHGALHVQAITQDSSTGRSVAIFTNHKPGWIPLPVWCPEGHILEEKLFMLVETGPCFTSRT